jgi:hypothetical protein
MSREGPIQPLTRGDTRTLLQADTANELIGQVNNILNLRVQIVNSGNSRMEISGENAVLVISTRDIDLGVITGSAGGNAALASLLANLANTFRVDDRTT